MGLEVGTFVHFLFDSGLGAADEGAGGLEIGADGDRGEQAREAVLGTEEVGFGLGHRSLGGNGEREAEDGGLNTHDSPSPAISRYALASGLVEPA